MAKVSQFLENSKKLRVWYSTVGAITGAEPNIFITKVVKNNSKFQNIFLRISPRKMTPMEPLPIFFDRRYLTLSSILGWIELQFFFFKVFYFHENDSRHQSARELAPSTPTVAGRHYAP